MLVDSAQIQRFLPSSRTSQLMEPGPLQHGSIPHGAVAPVPRQADVTESCRACSPAHLPRRDEASLSTTPSQLAPFLVLLHFCSAHLHFSRNVALVGNAAFLCVFDQSVVIVSMIIMTFMLRADSDLAISGGMGLSRPESIILSDIIDLSHVYQASRFGFVSFSTNIISG